MYTLYAQQNYQCKCSLVCTPSRWSIMETFSAVTATSAKKIPQEWGGKTGKRGLKEEGGWMDRIGKGRGRPEWWGKSGKSATFHPALKVARPSIEPDPSLFYG